MSDDTPRLKLGQMVDAQELDAMAVNDALIQLDAFTDICLLGQFVNTPPSSPADGDMYLLGAAPTGAWSGYAYKLAYCLDGGWRFYAPFDGLRAFVAGGNGFLVYHGGLWLDANALISAKELSIASAATCDLGAAASLCVQVTGSATITSLGTGANLLRLVHFAGALTLTYDATALILPGAANIATAAGDAAIFVSDASGHWRCQSYQRASGVPLNVSAVTGSGAMVLSAGPAFTGNLSGSSAGFSAGVSVNGASGGSNGLAVKSPGNGYVNGALKLVNSGATNNVYLTAVGAQLSISTDGSTDHFIINGAGAMGICGAPYADSGYNALSISPGSAGSEINLMRSGTPAAQFFENGAIVGIGSSSAIPVDIRTGGTAVARAATDGSFLVGTTTNGGWTGTAKLVAVQAGGTVLTVQQTAGSSNAASFRVDSTTSNLQLFYASTSLVGSITTNGTTTAYNTTSDARLKTVAPQRDHRDAIRALWVGDFTWNDSGALGFGVLAQQAYDVMPGHAGVTRPGTEDGAWHASAEPFAFLALWGVQDLYRTIEQLAARVAVLEAQDGR